jgi:flagellar biosynthesis/type III secretory pathway chaperone
METTAFFNELIQLLTQENDVHKHLIAVANDINKSTRAKNIEAIQQNCKIYDEHICSLERIEERRIEVCERLQNALSGKAPSGRLITLAEFCEPEQKKRLLEQKAALTKLVTELKAVNTSNTVLFREALGEINASVNIIRTSAQPKNGYRHKGDFKPAKSGRSIFNEVI